MWNMHLNNQYDYIVTGGGCAGLSFIMHLLNEPQLADKRILLIEKELKNQNDRTWCYWERGEGFFEEIIFCKTTFRPAPADGVGAVCMHVPVLAHA